MESAAPMEYSIEPAGPCRKRVKVTVPPERVTEEYDKSYRNWAKSVPIPGFRLGKAPRKLVEKRYGEQVSLEVRQALLDAAFEEAMTKNNLTPIADPELDVEKITVTPATRLDFDFTITVKPEIELPDLKAIEVSAPPAEPTPEDLDRALDGLRRRKATLRPVDGGSIEDGDLVTLRVDGGSEGKTVFHQESMVYEVGTRWFGGLIAEGIDEELRGKSIGAKVKAKAVAPPYDAENPFAGMDIAVEAEVTEHKRPELPPVDDALAKAYDFESLDAMRDAVRADVRERKARERERAIEEAAIGEILARVSFELPEDLIRREADEMARRAGYEMQMRGASEEETARRIAEIRERRAEESAREMKAHFVIDRVAEKERILVTETEVKEAIAVLAAYNQKSPEQMVAMLREGGRIGSLRHQLRERKARARLRERVKVKDAEPAAPAAAPAKKAKKKE